MVHQDPKPGTINIGGDVIHSIIVSGDHNRVFVGDYEQLRIAYIHPRPVFERVRLENFSGREWLLKEVDQFLSTNDRGVFILESGAGLGKTTFMAQLIKERGYIHHFVELAPGQSGIEIGRRNLAAQLVLAWHIDPFVADDILPASASRSDFFQNLLFQAAEVRDRLNPDEKIVLVIDALDEAGKPPDGQNVFGLPRTLPKGVYFLISQRPVQVALTMDAPRRVFHLDADNTNNLADMNQYLKSAAMWPGVIKVLKASGYTSVQFVEYLQKKCNGVWIYLHYVGMEIEQGIRSPLDLEQLPRNVWQYYAQYWQRWRDIDEAHWQSIYLPLLGTLAAIQTAMPLEQIIMWAGLGNKPSQLLHRLIEERWRPFLSISRIDQRPVFRLYHASLRNFMDAQADLVILTSQERALANELAQATREAHGRITDFLISGWGGIETGLTSLKDVAKLDINDQYGMRYLATHLLASGRSEVLYRIFRLDAFEGKRHINLWHGVKEMRGDTDGYLNDLRQAWKATEDENEEQSILLRCYYALIQSSIRNISTNISIDFLLALLIKETWTPIQAIVYARLIQDRQKGFQAYSRLALYFAQTDRTEYAIQLLRDIEDEKIWLDCIAALSPLIAEDLLPLITPSLCKGNWVSVLQTITAHIPKVNWEKIIQTIGNFTDGQCDALNVFLPDIPQDKLLNVLKIILPNILKLEYAVLLRKLMPRLPDDLRRLSLHTVQETIQRQLVFVRLGIQDTTALAELVSCLPEQDQRVDYLSRIYHAEINGDESSDSLVHWKAFYLTSLAPYLPTEFAIETIKKAFDLINRDRLFVPAPYLGILAEQLSQKGFLSEALEVALKLNNHFQDDPIHDHRRELIARLAPLIPDQLFQNYVHYSNREQLFVIKEFAAYLPLDIVRAEIAAKKQFAQDTWFEESRNERLSYYLPRLAALGFSDEAIAEALTIDDEELLADTIIGIAPYAAISELETLYNAALTIKTRYLQRARAMQGLVPYLPVNLLQKSMQEAWTRHDDAWYHTALRRLIKIGKDEAAIEGAIALSERLASWGNNFELDRDTYYSDTLEVFAAELSQPVIQRIAEDAIKNRRWKTLKAIAGSIQPDYFSVIVHEIIGLQDPAIRFDLLDKFIAYFPENLLPDLIELIGSLDENQKTSLVISLLPKAKGEKLFALLRIIDTFSTNELRQANLRRVTQELSTEKICEILWLLKNGTGLSKETIDFQTIDLIRAAQNIGDFLPREEAVTYLLGIADPKTREKQFDEAALQAVLENSQGEIRARKLLDLEPLLPSDLKKMALDEACRGAISIPIDKFEREEVFSKIAERFISLGLLEDAFRAIDRIRDRIDFAETFCLLAPRLMPNVDSVLLNKIFEYANDLDDAWPRAMTLLTILPYLPDEQKLSVLSRNHEHLSSFFNAKYEINFLSLLEIRVIKDASPYSPEIQALWHETINSLLEQVKKSGGNDLWKLAPYIPEDLLEDTLDIAQNSDNINRVLGLASLYSRFSDEDKKREISKNLINASLASIGYSANLDKLNIVLQPLDYDTSRAVAKHGILVIFERCKSNKSSWIPLKDEELINLVTSCIRNLSPYLSNSDRQRGTRLFLAWSLEQNEKIQSGIIPDLVELLPVECQQSAIEQAVNSAVKDGNHKPVLEKLSKVVTHDNCPDLRRILLFSPPDKHTPEFLSNRTRSDVYSDICDLAPFIAARIGPNKLFEVIDTIQIVGGWWP